MEKRAINTYYDLERGYTSNFGPSTLIRSRSASLTKTTNLNMEKAIRIVELADKVYVKEVLEAARTYILKQVLSFISLFLIFNFLKFFNF